MQSAESTQLPAQAYDHAFDLAASFADLGMNVEVLVQARCYILMGHLVCTRLLVKPDT